mmetsp:Transcript_25653/g.40749  ORF Transcript_25653/g.40749 Transcript_25653/m.40749 type:complete len:80 (-) Transcript_25653:693-932(-)
MMQNKTHQQIQKNTWNNLQINASVRAKYGSQSLTNYTAANHISESLESLGCISRLYGSSLGSSGCGVIRIEDMVIVRNL